MESLLNVWLNPLIWEFCFCAHDRYLVLGKVVPDDGTKDFGVMVKKSNFTNPRIMPNIRQRGFGFYL
jgi:hypothetical protein